MRGRGLKALCKSHQTLSGRVSFDTKCQGRRKGGQKASPRFKTLSERYIFSHSARQKFLFYRLRAEADEQYLKFLVKERGRKTLAESQRLDRIRFTCYYKSKFEFCLKDTAKYYELISFAPVAQLDRAPVYGTGCCWFKSNQAQIY